MRAEVGLLVVLPTGLFTLPTALLLALLGFLRGSLALRSLGLALRLGCLLLMLLRGPLLLRLPRLRLWLWRPRLRMGCRPSLRGRCLGRSRPLHLASALLRRLPT